MDILLDLSTFDSTHNDNGFLKPYCVYKFVIGMIFNLLITKSTLVVKNCYGVIICQMATLQSYSYQIEWKVLKQPITSYWL